MGWAFDPDTSASIPVHVYVDGSGYVLTASGDRPDVGSFFPGYGNAHGYIGVVPAITRAPTRSAPTASTRAAPGPTASSGRAAP